MNPSDFVNLHMHNEFSLVDGAMKTKDMASLAKEQGQVALAVTNHGNINGALRHVKACKEVGIKPIIGIESYVIDPAKIKTMSQHKVKRYHLTILIRDLVGLRLMQKALTHAWTLATDLNKFPPIPLDWPLTKGWKDHFVILTGCGSSPFWREGGGGEKFIQGYYETFGKDMYAEIMPLSDFSMQDPTNAAALKVSKLMGIKPVSTNDSHWLRADDNECHQVLLAIGSHQRWSDPNRWKFDSKVNYMRTPDEMLASYRKMGLDEALAKRSITNTMEVAEKCFFNFKDQPVELPPVLPEGEDEPAWMVDQCVTQLKKMGLMHNEKYLDRLESEIKAIVKGGFTRYILMVSELVNWARGAGIMVGPGRGSVSGSLICYLLGITQADPLKHNLIFERFISEGRVDLPDIDIDFEDRKRWMIEQHLKEKYGEWNVAHVSTFSMLRGKAAVKDVSRVFDVPQADVKKMCGAIVVRPEADSRASFSIMDTVEQFEDGKEFYKKYPQVIRNAAKLEGLVKGEGVHAAGLVVSVRDLRDGHNCALIPRKGSYVTNWDKKDLETMGLMKLDVLGLATLSVLEEFRTLVKQRHDKDVVWTDIDLEDRTTYEKTIKDGKTATCFQIGSRGLQKLCQQMKVDNFKTLVDASALWRPGCLKSGITSRYSECHLGQSEPEYLNDYHKEICKDTYGQVLYQEQIMFMMYKIAGIPWRIADHVRKIISKKQGGDEWEKHKKVFVDGCVKKKTLSPKAAVELWDKLKFFGQYSFNLSHSVTYTMVSFWTAWAKTHHPAEYMCSFLNYGAVGGIESMSQMTKLDEATREAQRLGLKIKPPDINSSSAIWSIDGEGALLAGLSQIKGISPETADLIIEARTKAGGHFNSLTELLAHINRRRVNKGIILKLLYAGAMDALLGEWWKGWILWFEDLYDLVLSEKRLKAKMAELEPQIEEQWARREAEYSDLRHGSLRYKSDFGGGGFGRFRKFLRQYVDIRDIGKLNGRDTVYVCAMATSVKYGYRENVKMMTSAKGPVEQAGTKETMGGVYGNLDDGTGFIMAVYNGDLYRERKATIEGMMGKNVLVRGRYVGGRNNLIVEQLWTLDELSRAKMRGLRLKALRTTKKDDAWTAFRKEIKACQKCNLRQGCKAPVPPSFGALRAMVVGEAPGANEDEQGQGFVGKAGDVLWRELAKLNGPRREDLFVANAVACRPTTLAPGVTKDNKLPNITFINKCPWLSETIARVKPKAILALGASAMYHFNGQPKGILEYNGKTEWVPKVGAWVTYCVHPSSTFYDPANVESFRVGLKEFLRVLGAIS